MNQLTNIRLLTLIALMLFIGSFTACKKDDAANSGSVQLLSFGPTGAQHGDTIKFIGNNLNLVTEIDFTGEGAIVEQSAFAQQTPEVILVVVPEEAEQGFVTLKTSQGDLVTKTKFNLMVAPSVATITAEARSGENITLTGQYLNWVTRVTFSDNKFVDTFVSKTINELVVKVPEDAQTGPLVLDYGGTEPATLQTDDTVKVTLPIITELSPSPIFHEQDLTITGTNLDLVKQITFTNVSTPVAEFVSQSATKIIVKVPASASKGKVAVVAASGVATQSPQDLDIILPAVTLMSPNPVKHEQNVTITGTNLNLAKQVTFAGTTTPVKTFVSQSATQIVVKVPAAAKTGKLTLTTAGGVSSISNQDLQLLIPVVTGMSPNPVDAGANLTISGTNLDLVSGIAFVGVTNSVTAFVSQSSTQIVVKVPTGALKGSLTFSIRNSTVTVESPVNLELTGGLPPLADFPYALYTDAPQNGYGDWSYTDTHDFASTAIVRQGTKSIKAVYNADNGYQGIAIHNDAAASVSAYTKVEFSVFGTAGTGGKKLNVVINKDYDHVLQQVTIKEGEWTTFSLSLSSLGSPAKITELALQSAGFGGTIYIDHVGLR